MQPVANSLHKTNVDAFQSSAAGESRGSKSLHKTNVDVFQSSAVFESIRPDGFQRTTGDHGLQGSASGEGIASNRGNRNIKQDTSQTPAAAIKCIVRKVLGGDDDIASIEAITARVTDDRRI